MIKDGKGKVLFFDRRKGFGFVELDGGGNDVYFRETGLSGGMTHGEARNLTDRHEKGAEPRVMCNFDELPGGRRQAVDHGIRPA